MKLKDKKRVLKSVLSSIDDEQIIKKVESLLGIKNAKTKAFGYYLKKLGVVLEEDNSNEVYRSFIKSGITEFDLHTGGWKLGSLNIISSHKGMGLSAFLTTITKHIAIKNNQSIAVFNLKYSSKNFVNQILASETGLSTKKLNNGHFEKHEVDQLNKKTKTLGKTPIYLDDSSSLTVISLKNKISNLIKEKAIKIVLIDCLEKIIGKREQVIRDLDSVAKELQIPILVCYTLPPNWVDSLSVSHRPTPNSFMKKYSSICFHDFIESLTFIYRPEYYHILKWEDGSSCEGQAELICYGDKFAKKDIRLNFAAHFSMLYDFKKHIT